MEQLAHEVYGESAHFWYRAGLSKEHQYGWILDTSRDNIPKIVERIHQDLGQKDYKEGVFWYFGKEIDKILLMVRYKDGQYILQVNLKDFDFALHIDQITAWKEEVLAGLRK